MATILSRKNWTSTRAGGTAMNMGRMRGIVGHYPAAGKDIGVISKAAECSRLRGWRNYHVRGRGWADLGYNFAIGQSGRIYEGRGLRVGAHATGHNSTTVGVLFIVGDNEELTQEARDSFKALRAYLRKKGVGAGVWGHQQMSGASTRCPGPYIMSDIRAGRLSGGSGAATPGGGGGGSTYKTVNKTAPLGLYDKDAKDHSRIEDWQTDALGYDEDESDGYFGPDTERDTKALQRQLGVKDDGLVGDDTMSAWKKAGKPKLKKSAPSKPKPKPSTSKAPKFPLPKGHWYGVESSNPKNHSGYWKKDRVGIEQWQKKMRDRGWTISVDGIFGPGSAKVARQFQKEKGLGVDGLVGRKTWDATWEEPVT